MSGASNALNDQAHALRVVADEIETLLDSTRNRLEGAMTGRLFAGTIAEETALGVTDNRRRLQEAARLLRDDAARHERQAAQIESTDSPWTDVTDFVT